MAKICPNCNKKMDSLMTTHSFRNEQFKNVVNELTENYATNYCSRNECVDIYKLSSDQEILKSSLQNTIQELSVKMPILTTHNPLNWEYDAISIVSGQSVTGTGVFSEVLSGFSDFFGAQSESFKSKLVQGENLCRTQLRINAGKLGANAIIATDIDYSEVGGGKGMLMVCMAGTAVRVKNFDKVYPGISEALENLANDIKAMQKVTYNLKVLKAI